MTSSLTDHHIPTRTAVALGVTLALVFGAGVAVQTRINGELGRQLGDGYLAALISFGSGLVVLSVALLFMPSGRNGLRTIVGMVRRRDMPWYYVLGGTAGAFVVLSQGLTAAVLGVALFTVAIVAGQTISGLALDRRGMGTMRPKALTVARIAGSALTLVAVGIAVSAQIVGNIPLWMLVMPFISGLGIGWQQAVNGQVRVQSGSALTATFVNFVVGFTLLLIATLVHSAFAGWPTALPQTWWLYSGGMIGVIFIAAAAVLVRTTGVLLLGLGTIAGQLLSSLLLDVIVPPEGREIVATTVVGTLLALVAVAIAALPSRKAVNPNATAGRKKAAPQAAATKKAAPPETTAP
ncbi:MAG: DMT family transporter [Microbacteriaceae bacterium]